MSNEDRVSKAEIQASREKTWSELVLEEKIERLRRVLQQRGNQLDVTVETLNKAVGDFYQHEHGERGNPVVPAAHPYGNLATPPGGSYPLGYRSNRFDPLD